MDIPRRSALRVTSSAVVAAFAGCVGGATEDDLSFTAEVIAQQSASEPARVEATLSNVGSTAVEIGFGPTLLFSDNLSSDDLQWSKELVLDPQTRAGPPIEPERTEDGCWRVPGDRDRPIESSLEFRSLSPGQSVQEVYDVYTWTDASACLPEGTYRFQDKGPLGDDSRSMTLTLVLEVDSNQRLSATGRDPAIEAE